MNLLNVLDHPSQIAKNSVLRIFGYAKLSAKTYSGLSILNEFTKCPRSSLKLLKIVFYEYLYMQN